MAYVERSSTGGDGSRLNVSEGKHHVSPRFVYARSCSGVAKEKCDYDTQYRENNVGRSRRVRDHCQVSDQ